MPDLWSNLPDRAATGPGASHYDVLGITIVAVADLPEPRRTQFLKRAYRRALLKCHPDKAPRKNGAEGPDTGASRPAADLSLSPPPPPLVAAEAAAARPRAPSPLFTVDQISVALAVLSDPRQKGEYDRALRLSSGGYPCGGFGGGGGGGGNGAGSVTLRMGNSGTAAAAAAAARPRQSFKTGVESADLDDLEHEEGGRDGSAASSASRQQGLWWRACRCGNPRGFLVEEADLEEAAGQGEVMVGCADCSLWLRVHFAVADDEDHEDEAAGAQSGMREEGAS